MNIQKFVTELQEELEFEQTLTLETDLKAADEWDSMAAMVLIAFVSDNFDKQLTAEDLKEITTIDSLIEIIGRNKFQ